MLKSRFVNRSLGSILAFGLLSGALVSLPAVAKKGDDDKKKGKYIYRISATAYHLGGGARTFNVDIGIIRWSTDEERAALLRAIKDGGTEGATKEMEKGEELGFIRVAGGYQVIHYAREFEQDGKRQIILATNRPLRFGEVQYGLPTQLYTVSLANIELNEKNKGEGQLAPYCMITFNEENQRLDVEQNSVEPVRLSNVRIR